MGRPRQVGARLATLKSRLEDTQTDWQLLTIDGWYGGRTAQRQVISQTALWYHTL